MGVFAQLIKRGGTVPDVICRPRCEWAQLRPGFNWRTFSLIKLEIEDDRMMGAVELDVALIGFGLLLRVTYMETEAMTRILRQVEQFEEDGDVDKLFGIKADQ